MCTAISLLSKQNEVFLGRTMDIAYELGFELFLVPKNYQWKSIVSGKLYCNLYSFIASGKDVQGIHFSDGMNEVGLGVVALLFPEYGHFETIDDGHKDSIASVDFITYLLGNCADISQVIEKVSSLHIVGVKDFTTNTITPLHWIVADKSGKTITIEQTNGGLHIFKNPIGLLTNSPDFLWQVANLRNYITLSPQQPSATRWGLLL